SQSGSLGAPDDAGAASFTASPDGFVGAIGSHRAPTETGPVTVVWSPETHTCASTSSVAPWWSGVSRRTRMAGSSGWDGNTSYRSTVPGRISPSVQLTITRSPTWYGRALITGPRRRCDARHGPRPRRCPRRRTWRPRCAGGAAWAGPPRAHPGGSRRWTRQPGGLWGPRGA